MQTRKIEINGAAATARNILTRGSMQVYLEILRNEF